MRDFVEFDSYLVPESDLVEGALRMLDGDGNTGGDNTFSTADDNVADCEHRSRNRIPVADCDDFAESPVNCTYCENTCLNGTEGQTAIICEACGAGICEDCNAPNSDSDYDSGLGEE